eukprot:scaffold3_cov108-Isochrysis_galbana.AAC.2
MGDLAMTLGQPFISQARQVRFTGTPRTRPHCLDVPHRAAVHLHSCLFSPNCRILSHHASPCFATRPRALSPGIRLLPG